MRLQRVSNITAYPMQIGEERHFCTKFTLPKRGSNQVSAELVKLWFNDMVRCVFGEGLEVVGGNGYRFRSRLFIHEPFLGTLLLRSIKPSPGEPVDIAKIFVQGGTPDRLVFEEEVLIAIPRLP